MKVLLYPVLLSAALYYSPVNAAWRTTVEDDLFSSSGKSAVLGGTLTSDNHLIIFDCTNENLRLSLVESDDKGFVQEKPANIIFKVDDQTPTKMSGVIQRRSSAYVQATVTERDMVLSVLKAIHGAKSKVLVGLETGDRKHTFSGDAKYSTLAVNEFTRACDINL